MTRLLPGLVAILVLAGWSAPNPALEAPAICAISQDPDPPPYYAIEMVTTKRVPTARMATGVTDVTFRRSPFGVAVNPEGSYTYNLHLQIDKIRAPRSGVYAVWVTTPDLKNVTRLGTLDEYFRATGTVDFNKFIVVVSLEERDDPEQARWQGAIVLRGMSRSGLMHTMAGHGPFESEPCAVYGYR